MNKPVLSPKWLHPICSMHSLDDENKIKRETGIRLLPLGSEHVLVSVATLLTTAPPAGQTGEHSTSLKCTIFIWRISLHIGFIPCLHRTLVVCMLVSSFILSKTSPFYV